MRIDPPVPTYAPDVSVFYGLAANTGKRSVLLDVMHPDGRRALEDLLRDADVFVVNCTMPCLQRLGLTPAELARINPRLVLARFDAWGGPTGRGRMAQYNGYDDCVQAGQGIMSYFGGLQTPEEHAHIGVIDVCAGVAGAAATVAALLERARTGRVRVARSSLAAVGQYLQLPFMCGVMRRSVRGKLDCRVGEHALHRCLRASDGWFLVVLPSFDPHDKAAFVRVAKKLFQGDVRAVRSEEAWSKLTVNQACRGLRACGLEACPLRSLSDVRATCARPNTEESLPPLSTLPTFVYQNFADHPVGGLVMVAPTAMRMHGVTLSPAHAPKVGAHTTEILSTRLIITGAARTSWSRNYVPFSAKCAKCGTRGRRCFVAECDHILCLTCLGLRPAHCVVCGGQQTTPWNVRSWRRAYGDWRRGAFRGAVDLHHQRHDDETYFIGQRRRRRARSLSP